MTRPVRLILASASPQRRQLLAAAGYRFEVLAPHASAECGVCSTGGPAALVRDLALRKAADAVRQLVDRDDLPRISTILVACDTLAECGGEVLGKPVDEEHARRMLQRLSGERHRVYSGLCVWPQSGQETSAQPEVRVAVTELRMDPLSDGDLEEYLASGLWRGKAGAFGYQDRSGWLHVVEGSESNVIGLPMELLAAMLAPLGCVPDAANEADGLSCDG